MSLLVYPLALLIALVGMAAWGLGYLAGAFVVIAGAICLMVGAWEG